jgi:G patch domain-containing protein 1
VLKAGFGLGALNDAEDDDVDVYDGDIKNRNDTRRMAYDVSEGDDGERIVIGRGGQKGKTGMVRILLSR